MHLSFENLGEFEEFARFCGFARADLYKEGIIAAQGYDNRDVRVVGADPLLAAEYGANPVETLVDKLPATPVKRTRRTKAEMEADRQRAAAAMAAPLEDDALESKEELTEEAAVLAALTAASASNADLADGEAYVDTATYVGLHAARLASEVSAKDFLTRCQAFIQKHSLISYGEIMTASGVEPRAVASCDAAKRGEILARMEWQEKDFAPAKA